MIFLTIKKLYAPTEKKNIFLPPPHKIFTTEIKIFSIFGVKVLRVFIFSRFWPLPKKRSHFVYYGLDYRLIFSVFLKN